MSKQRYKIPTSLDVSYFDMEFNMRMKNGVGINKPVSAKVLFFGMIALFGWFYMVFQTFIGKGGIPIIIGFSIAWLLISILLVRADKTNRMGLELTLSMINYIPKSGRHIPVRLSDQIYGIKKLLNIDSVDVEDGMIHFLDGQIGYVYHVVGSASSLMFEQDKRIVLDKVDAFYRKLPVGVEPIFDTLYEGHSVEEQLEAVRRDASNLNVRSKGLESLLEERHGILYHAINNSTKLRSLHQYLVVRAPSEDLLKEFENLVIGDVEGSGLMFRLARTLSYNEVEKYLKSYLNASTKRELKRFAKR